MSEFDVEGLKAAAVAQAGLDDFGETFDGNGLNAWVEDLAHPRLNASGKALMAQLMVGDLVRRLQVVDCLKRHPEIDDVVIPPILYISGLERSGTTLLHNLLSLPSSARPLLRWELMRPTPPPETDTYRSDPRVAEIQASIDRRRGTLLEHMHWVDADDPEECQWGMIDGSSLMGGAPFPIMPNWARWYLSRDVETGFREYRQVMKVLLWKNPVPEGGHLVLKCPQILDQLATFARVFPEARFALLLRDPYRVAVSMRSLLGSILAPLMAEGYRPDDSDAFYTDLIERVEARLPLLAEFAKRGEGVATIRYSDLVAEPAIVAEGVQRELGFAVDAGFASLVDDFLRAQKEGKRAKPPGSLPPFGLDHEAFLARPAIAAYCRQFGIEPERRRQTGA